MATKKRNKVKILLEESDDNSRSYRILEASVNDQFCIFKYEIIKGVGLGQVHGVTDKKNIVDDDLLDSFSKFRVHLAFIDNVFLHSHIDVTDIDKLHTHELTQDYAVNGFKIKSKKGFETIQLIGEKHVAMGWESITSPEITLDNLGGYTWYNELMTAANDAREEVALYNEGKGTPVKPAEEKKESKNQASVFDSQKEQEEVEPGMEEALNSAKVD